MKKKLAIGLVLVIMLLSLAGCAATTKTYSSHGLEITMKDDFIEKSIATATVYYVSNDAIFTGLKESFEELSVINLGKDSTVDEYAEAVLANNQVSYDMQKDGDLTYFTYEATASGKDFFYLSALEKSNDAFWILTFACEKDNKDKYEPLFKEWAKTVKFE